MNARWLAFLLACAFNVPAADGSEFVKVGEEFQVSSGTYGNNDNPSIATLSEGGFVIVWQRSDEERGYCDLSLGAVCATSEGCPSGLGACIPIARIFSQRFDASGDKVGTEFRIDSDEGTQEPAFFHGRPRVAPLPDNGFVVAWEQESTSDESVMASRFDEHGKIGNDFRVSEPSSPEPRHADIGSDAAGNFLIVWDREESGIYGKRFDQSGNVLGSTFGLAERGDQQYPSLSVRPNGDFVVSWVTTRMAFARQFFSNGLPNGELVVVEPGPLVDVGSRICALLDLGFIVGWGGYILDDEGNESRRSLIRRYDHAASILAEGSNACSAKLLCLQDSSVVGVCSGVHAQERSSNLSTSRLPLRVSEERRENRFELNYLPAIAQLSSEYFVATWSHVANHIERPFNGEIRARRIRLVPDITCGGDCNGNGAVTIDELLSGVAIGLDQLTLSTCPPFDQSNDTELTIDELVAAVGKALEGCGQ